MFCEILRMFNHRNANYSPTTYITEKSQFLISILKDLIYLAFTIFISYVFILKLFPFISFHVILV